MTTPDEQAYGKARRDAMELVDEAVRSGRIIQADHDLRVAQLRGATSSQDVDLVVRDLRPATAAATASAPVAAAGASAAPAGEPWPLVNYGPAGGHVDIATSTNTRTTTPGRVFRGIIAFFILLAVVVPVAVAVIAYSASRDAFPSFDDVGPTDDTTYLPGQPPGEDGVNLFTVEGFTDLADALQEETGQRFVYAAAIYPRYAVLQVPTGTNTRYQNWYWDGQTLELQDDKSSSSNDQFDLTLLDPRRVIDLVDQVRAKIDEPDSWYVSINDFEQTETQIAAYASNDFDETAYLIATLDGTIVYDSTP